MIAEAAQRRDPSREGTSCWAMMAFMLDLLDLPQTYLALYLVVDRFFDYPITALNVWGDLIVAAVVDRSDPKR